MEQTRWLLCSSKKRITVTASLRYFSFTQSESRLKCLMEWISDSQRPCQKLLPVLADRCSSPMMRWWIKTAHHSVVNRDNSPLQRNMRVRGGEKFDWPVAVVRLQYRASWLLRTKSGISKSSFTRIALVFCVASQKKAKSFVAKPSKQRRKRKKRWEHF